MPDGGNPEGVSPADVDEYGQIIDPNKPQEELPLSPGVDFKRTREIIQQEEPITPGETAQKLRDLRERLANAKLFNPPPQPKAGSSK